MHYLQNNWVTNTKKINFPKNKNWQKYVDSKQLEITCGEAPYIVSRYDTTTGEIIDINNRIGLLDRKIRIVNENTKTEEEWLKWIIRAFQSVYEYEYQGDNLLITRINLLMTFIEYTKIQLHRNPTKKEISKIANIISWNFFQINGLDETIPVNKSIICKIYDWQKNCSIPFQSLKEKNCTMKFDAIIGNPPYQKLINNKSLAKQLFPIFIQKSIELTNKYVVLITPSRWFTANAQDKSFLKLRKFIKNNNHMQSLYNYKNEKDLFPNTEIKGGVNYFFYNKDYNGKVKFVNIEKGVEKSETKDLFEKNMDIIISDSSNYSILSKVKNTKDFVSLTTITTGRNAFGIIGKEDVVNAVSKKDKFENAIELRCKANTIRWTSKEYITKNLDIVDKYKVFISKSAGNPNKDFKVIGIPYVGNKGSVCTDSLFPISKFDTKQEAENLAKYMKTKFLRYMVYIIKMSQNVTQIVYKFVPIQNFKDDSDINWSTSINEIDKQLYQKYNLSEFEINIIESKIKEMS